MNRGFVFGKFLPFHKGHEAMINFALQKCDFLSILICCSDKESIPCTVRKHWIESTFSKIEQKEVIVYNYLESELPNTSVSSREVSKLWSAIFSNLFPLHNVLITSESYGNYVAEYMGIQHVPYDIKKEHFPISSSILRKDIFSNFKYLPYSVKPDYAIKIVLLGSESTGKTTLAKRLSKHFECSLVEETAREIIANSNDFSIDDLYKVANAHAINIDSAILKDCPLIIIDTDIHITLSYAKFIFAKTLNIENAVFNSNKANLYLYLNNDVVFEQDGTRLNEEARNLLDISHRQIIQEYGINPIEVNGNWDERFTKAVEHIEKLIASYELSQR